MNNIREMVNVKPVKFARMIKDHLYDIIDGTKHANISSTLKIPVP